MSRNGLGIFIVACALFWATPAPAAPSDVRVAIDTDRGEIVVVLDPAHAPITVRNFLHYVARQYFSGGTFFRVVPGFMIQGGNRAREDSADTPIPLEAPSRTGIRNRDGAISMARKPDPNSGQAEFFICDGDQPELDGSATVPGYAAFGHVVAGMDIVRQIARLPATGQMLLTPVHIIRIYRKQ